MCYISPSKVVDNRDKIDKLWPINLVIQGLCLDSMLRIPEVQVQVAQMIGCKQKHQNMLILKFPHEMCCFSCGVIWLSIVEMSCFLNLLWQPQEPFWTENYAVKRAKMPWFMWTATAFDIQKPAEEPTGEEEEDEEGRWGFLELPVELFILMTWVPLLDDGYQTYGCWKNHFLIDACGWWFLTNIPLTNIPSLSCDN